MMDHLRPETRRVLNVLQAHPGWHAENAVYIQAALHAPTPEDVQSRAEAVTRALRELDEAGYPVEWQGTAGGDFYRLASAPVTPSFADIYDFS